MSNVSPYGAPGVGMTTTGNPAIGGNNDTTSAPLMSGRAGQLLVSETRGQFGEMSHRGGVFFGCALTSAIAIPVATTTSGSTFALYNPPGSGVYVEPIDFDLLQLAAFGAAVSTFGFSVVNSVTNVVSAITQNKGPTTVGTNSSKFNGPASQAQLCSAITFASALTVAANFALPMFRTPTSYLPTATVTGQVMHYVFNGKLIIPPGWCITLVGTTATGANTAIPSISWAEYQV